MLLNKPTIGRNIQNIENQKYHVVLGNSLLNLDSDKLFYSQ
jgi:hypothetical protein